MSTLIPDLPPDHWFWLMLSALLIGMAKAGVKGMGLIVVPIMASVFGGKPSAGIVLPMLIAADIFAVRYYNRHARWEYLWKLLPAAAVGVLIGVWVGNIIRAEVFDFLIVIFIVSCLLLMLWQERSGLPPEITQSWYFGITFGLIGGFSTMIGNAAGPFLAVYLLSTRLPKNNFIGTGAWFFFLINLFKVPFHIFIWETITWPSLQLNLFCIPVIAIGILIGIRIVKWIPEREFRYFIIIMTSLISARLVWQTFSG